LIITAILCGMLGSVHAQSKTDTLKTSADTLIIKHKKHQGHVKMNWNFDTDSAREAKRAAERAKPKNGFSIGLTLDDFYLGFATLMDNGSFTLSQKNSFLNYNQAKTSDVGFTVFKFGYRFNQNFKVSLAAGFDWTLIRLQQNIDLVPDQPTLKYRVDTVNHYSKNRFSSNYLLLPLTFELRSKEDSHGKRFHFNFGPEGGFLIDGMQKQISPERGKTKNFNDFHLTRFEYGAFTKIGYGSFGIFAKYYFNDMFENSPDQQGLKNFSFGLQFGF